jgi:hypothetical protein
MERMPQKALYLPVIYQMNPIQPGNEVPMIRSEFEVVPWVLRN